MVHRQTYFRRLHPILFLIVPALLFTARVAWAHRMVVRMEEENVAVVAYDDGTAAPGCRIRLYDIKGNKIDTGSADENGRFVFDPAAAPFRIVAEDGLGHRAVWRPESEENFVSSVPLPERALLGVGIFLFTAAFFYYRNTLTKR